MVATAVASQIVADAASRGRRSASSTPCAAIVEHASASALCSSAQRNSPTVPACATRAAIDQRQQPTTSAIGRGATCIVIAVVAAAITGWTTTATIISASGRSC